MDKFFEKAQYIKAGRKFDRENSIKEAAPLFRKKFNLCAFGNAKIYVQGLGIAHFYLNGKRVTEDLFISPVSDYDKILWVNEYDVTSLLKDGENVCAVICVTSSPKQTHPEKKLRSTMVFQSSAKSSLRGRTLKITPMPQ